MSNIYKVKSVEDLFNYIEVGYRLDFKLIHEIFKLSRTKIYENLYKNVTKVKISKSIRNRLSEDILKLRGTGYTHAALLGLRIVEHEISVLFNAREVLYYLFENHLLVCDLYNTESNKYTRMTDLKEDDNLIYKALTNSRKRSDLQREAFGILEETEGYKTAQSKFYAEISKRRHFRFIICGVHCYAIIDNIKFKVPPMYDLKDEGLELMKKVRNA